MVTAAPASLSIPSSGRRRMDYIDALRGFACLWVMLHHTFSHRPIPAGVIYWPYAVLVKFSNIGWLGVSLFLVLSGFCLYYPLIRKNEAQNVQLDVREFARRRIRRITPPYYAALVFSLIWRLYVAHKTHFPPLSFVGGTRTLLLHIAFLNNIYAPGMNRINASFWSLALEMQLYLFFPFFVWLFRKKGAKGLLIGSGIIPLCWQAYAWSIDKPSLPWDFRQVTLYAVPARVFEFALGMFAASLVARPRRSQNRIALALTALLILPAAYVVLCVARWAPLLDQTWGVIWACGLIALARVPDAWFESHPLLKALTRLGLISYSTYLLHMTIMGMINSGWMHVRISSIYPYVVFGLLRIGIIIGAGYLFWRVFELPFMNTKPNIRSNRGLRAE